MDDLGLHEGENHQDYPEKDDHPSLESFLGIVIIVTAPKSLECKNRNRENTNKQDHKMIEQESTMPGIFSIEKPDLVMEEFRYDAAIP